MERLTRKELSDKGNVLCNIDFARNETQTDCNDSCKYGNCKWNKKALHKLKDYEDMEEKGLIAQCTCKECNKGDWSGCAEGTIYCMEHGAYFSWSDYCNKAEKDDE